MIDLFLQLIFDEVGVHYGHLLDVVRLQHLVELMLIRDAEKIDEVQKNVRLRTLNGCDLLVVRE